MLKNYQNKLTNQHFATLAILDPLFINTIQSSVVQNQTQW